MRYYTALAYTDYEAVITYRNCTNPAKLVEWVKNNRSVTKVFFYLKSSRKAPHHSGKYVMCWHLSVEQRTGDGWKDANEVNKSVHQGKGR